MARKKRKTENNNAVIFFAENFIKVHNEHNFTALMNAMDECLRRYIKSIVKDDYATSDVLSRVMEIVYYKTGDFEDRPHSLLKWIYLIAFRTSVSYLRGELDAEGKPTQEGLVKCSETILNDIKAELENNHWEEEWVDFLLAKKYGVFTGDEMASEKNVDCSDILFRMISHISHDMQNDIEEVEFRKRPPMFVFSGTPKYYTGLKQFYENFNVLFCKVTPELPENMFAFLEMQKHTFCNVETAATCADDVKTFYENYLENPDAGADPNRTTVLIEKADKADEIFDKAKELKIRVIASLKAVTSGALDL